MKKLKSRSLLLFTLIFTMLFSTISVDAATYTLPAQVATLYASKDTKYDSIAQKYISKNETVSYFCDQDIYPKTIKSSKTSVAAPGRKISKKYSMAGYNFTRTFAYVKVKKAGTTTISGKDGGTCQYKLTVKKYANPFSSLKLNNSNITSRFKTNSVYTLSYAKYKNKKVKLHFKVKNGWTIDAQSSVAGSLNASIVKNGGSVKVSKKGYTITLHATNKKTGQYETCEIIWK